MTLDAWMEIAHGQMLWLEAHRHPVLDAVFLFFTALGSEPFLLLFVAFGYWRLDRRLFARAALMLVVAGFLNTWLKGAFLEPRPSVSQVHASGGWSFPSGHAQVAAALWGGLAWDLRARPRLAGGLVLLALLVTASRPYLGVHYPHDVLAGLLLGGLQVLALVGLDRAGARLPDSGLGRGALALAGVLALLLVFGVFHPSVQGLGARLAGAGAGLALGISVGVPASARRGRLVLVGLVGLVALWLGLKAALVAAGLGAALLPAFGRYLLIGLWVSAGAPALARRWLDRPAERA